MEVESQIRFLSGPLTEKTIDIQKPEITIGRDKQNDICVLDPKVSRRHARIYRQGDAWTIENLSQSSYVAVNQQRVQQSVLQHNAIVKLGENTSFVFVIQQPVSIPLLRTSDSVDGVGRAPYSSVSSPSMPPVMPDVLPPVRRQPTIPTNVSPSGTVLLSSEPHIPLLSVTSNVHSNLQRYPLSKQIINIGRDPDNDIALAEAIISGRHAQVVRDGENLFLVHPHPSRDKTLNGLWYQGMPVRGDQPFRKQLAHGDIFRIGSEYGTLVTFAYDDGSGASTETLPEMPPIQLTKDRLTIGRASDNMVVLNHLQVSAHHAVLEKVENGYCILDNHSTNHVYVSGQIVTDQVLRTGDEIRIGPYRFTYTGTELRQYDESAHIRIDAHRLKRLGTNSIVLLNDISLTIPPRKFVALVGGSGAGKSTLMNALNGLRPAQEGTVSYNGVDYYKNLAAFNTQLGYVPQDDIVHRDLTVARALYYAARLRLASDLTKQQIQWRINEVLEDVEMTDRRNLMISKLSGGQRKRVSIALELLANPSVFFLDEPTSGLDPGLDRKMMALLRRLADRGRTIILVTHATNNINACDYVCFLARGGRMAYFGPPNKAKEFFEKPDFAEIYSELEPTKDQPDIPAQAEARFRASPDYQQYVVAPLSERPVQQTQQATTGKKASTNEKNRQQSRQGRAWSQFRLLSRRYLELLKNDTGYLLILLLQAPVIAILVVLMARIQMSDHIFKPDSVVQCQATALDSSNNPEISIPTKKAVTCSDVRTFLKDAQNAQIQDSQKLQDPQDPQGSQKRIEENERNKAVQDFIRKKGGQSQALQDFIIFGSGSDAQKILFIVAFTSILFGCVNGVREIVKELPIYERERAVNLGIMPYMLSKVVVLGILCLLQSAVMTLVVELGLSLHQGESVFLSPVLETYITLCLATLTGLMIGLTISAIAPNNDRAVSFLPLVLLPQVIFSGALIPLKDWPSQIMAVFFPSRWSMTALGTSLGLHVKPLGDDHLFGTDDSYHGKLFSVFSQADAMQRLELSWVALGALIIGLMIVIAIFLKRKDARG
jgi:ABC transport system ATP-binding/permease protein